MDLAFDTDNIPWLKDRLLYLTRSGSHAYGTALPTSDEDFRGIVVPPLPYFFGNARFDQAVYKKPDLVLWDVRRFFKLAADANPNIIEILWTDPADHIVVHPFAQMLIDHRELFLSRRVLHTFGGFAKSSLRRIRNNAEGKALGEGEVPGKDLLYGYNTKAAMHLVRLMRMCGEILNGQGVLVRRPDAEELLSIRDGGWKLDDLYEWVTQKEGELQRLAETSPLPKSPKHDHIEALCIEIVSQSFNHEVLVPVMQTGFDAVYWSFGRGTLTEKKLLDESVSDEAQS